MAEYLVTGIAPTSDPQQLEHSLLESCKFDTERLAVVTKARQTAAHDESPLRFVHADTSVGGRHAMSSGMTAAIMSGSGGTSVPGIGGSNASLSSFSGGSNVPNYMGDLPVPHDARQNYNMAIHEGRSVVTYKASEEEAPQMEQAFRACGLRNVKVFKPKVTTASS
jgi:hypothetical protein